MSAKIKSKANTTGSKFRMLLIIILFALLPLFISMQYQINDVAGHSRYSVPMEIYSLWNDSSLIIDGEVNFNATNLASEWSSAAVYNMYDNTNTPSAKLLLQNDNTTLYVGIDATNQITEPIITTWGASVYFDVDHNGELSTSDRVIRIITNTSSYVILYYFNTNTKSWTELEDSTLGGALPSGIIGNTIFDNSSFNEIDHRQYEFKIPFSIINAQAGKIIGVSFETFENYQGSMDEITWPYIGNIPSVIRSDAAKWGDLYFGLDTHILNYYSQFSIEQNTNIMSSAVGYNNGTFLGQGDINNDGNLELIVASNRTVSGQNKLLAIYQFISGDFIRIWNSWESQHQSKMIQVKSIACYDFTGDGKDEIFVVGEDSRILRFSDWNSISNDFDNADYAFSHTSSLMGYITIGDGNNNGNQNLVFGDSNGYVNVLDYVAATNSFTHDKRSPFSVWLGTGYLKRIHAIAVGDLDGDSSNEIAFLGQITTDDGDSTTRLFIYQKSVAKYLDDTGDNLPSDSTLITEDQFGHTIQIADVDNDLENEIVLAGKKYVKIFGKDSFLDAKAPLEFSTNDGFALPAMGGGVLVADVNADNFNELVLGANNGSLYIFKITDSGSDTLSYELEWESDIGTSPGKRRSIIAYDFDFDSETEIAVTDNFGQIFIIGKSAPPEFTITSPTTGSSFAKADILVSWLSSDDFAMHHYDIYMKGLFQGRTSGSQTGFVVFLPTGSSSIEVIGFDVNGKNASDIVTVTLSATAPEVHILVPDNYFETTNSQILIEYESFDLDNLVHHYNIYVNNIGSTDVYETTYLVNLDEGINNITVVAVDETNNTGRYTIFIIRDSTGPIIDITSPSPNSAVSLTEIEVHWTASDALTDVSYFDIYIDGDYFITTFENSYLIPLNAEKEFEIIIYAFDTLGNPNQDSVHITRDTIQPDVSILSPSSGQYFENLIMGIAWESNDNIGGSGIHHSEIVVNQQTKYIGTNEFAIIDFGTEGIKDVVVTTYDKAGNIASDYISLIIDNSNPFIVIVQPEDNFKTSLDKVALSWLANDTGSGIKEYNIFINDILYRTITDPNTKEAIVPLAINQMSIIKLQAIDFMNNTYNSSITVYQNTTIPTLSILQPISLDSFCSVDAVNITWDIAGISDLIRFEIYRDNILIGNITEISARDFTVDLTSYPVDQYITLNITVIAITSNPNNTAFDIRWIHLDQLKPLIFIYTPANNTEVYSQGLYLQWIGSDTGSGIYRYDVLINNETFKICTSDKNFLYLLFYLGDGLYTITVIAYDNAQNSNNASIMLSVFLLSPDFSANIPTEFYSNTGVFNFNLTVIDPRSGIKYLTVMLDDNYLFNESYESAIRYDPFWVIIGVTETDYSVFEGEHDLSLIVIDYYNKEVIKHHTIYIDTEDPEILNTITIDDDLLISGSTDIIVDPSNPAGNNHTFTLTVTDNYAIESVEIIITGNGYNNSYELVRVESFRAVVIEYTITLDFTGLDYGSYQITFRATDYAGNEIDSSYSISVSEPTADPWYGKIDNIIYLSAGILFFVVWMIFLTVMSRRSQQNRKWEDNVIAVMFIKETGLTAVFVPYSSQIVHDEQLIGGAMVAVKGILEDFAVDKRKYHLEILETGAMNMLICNGQYSLGIALVRSVKPIHKTKIVKLTKEFEKQYKKPLQALYHVDSESFAGAENMIKQYFGPPVKEEVMDDSSGGIASQLKTATEEFQEKEYEKIAMTARLVDTIDHLTSDNKRRFLRIIEFIPKIIISLTERRISDAETEANALAMDLDYLIEEDRADAEFNQMILSILKISKEFFYSIETLKQNNIDAYETAIKNATKIWFEEIAEKVS